MTGGGGGREEGAVSLDKTGCMAGRQVQEPNASNPWSLEYKLVEASPELFFSSSLTIHSSLHHTPFPRPS
jgi:hypothetical protein